MLRINLSDEAVGIILKDVVRRAIEVIRLQRASFEAKEKRGYSGDMNDVFTTADLESQEVYVKILAECFPGVGIIAEENVTRQCIIEGVDAYFTIDPLDGTKAFVRQQSHGVATMIAFVVNGTIISAWIGDVNTCEVYGYRPGSDKVHRLIPGQRSQYLHELKRDRPLSEQNLLLRDYGMSRMPAVLPLLDRFHDVQIDGGSLGAWFTRLWKGEAGAAILPPNAETPWDSTPVIGISQRLGFVFFATRPEEDAWKLYDPRPSKQVWHRKETLMAVHRSAVKQLFI